MQSTSPSGSGKGSGDGAPDVRLHTSGLHLHGGKHPGRCSVSFPRDSRLASSPLCVPGDYGKMGSPMINLFASNASKQTQRFYSWDASNNPEGVNALSQRWDLPLAYAFPPIALKRVVKKLVLYSLLGFLLSIRICLFKAKELETLTMISCLIFSCF
jgi:hypothetical protein